MIKNKFIRLFLTALIACCFIFGTASAGKITTYSNMLSSRNCTIRYTNVTPAVRIHNIEAVRLGFEAMRIPPLYINQSYKGIIVLRDTDSYNEVDYGTFAKCVLRNKDEVFSFNRETKDEEVNYSSSKGKNKVVAESFDIESMLLYGENFGPADVSRLFTAMLPADKKPAGSPEYKYVGEGELPDGRTYEDYRTDTGTSGLEAVRFYFQGNELTRIAAASYFIRPDGKMDGRKCVLNINEFVNIPDSKLLKLPEKVEDNTERGKNK